MVEGNGGLLISGRDMQHYSECKKRSGAHKNFGSRVPLLALVMMCVFLLSGWRQLGAVSEWGDEGKTTQTSQFQVSSDEGKSEQRLVKIDFEDVDILRFIKFISEITGRNFLVDPKVKGKVTIVSATELTVDEAYAVFQSVLEVHGFTIVPAGSIIKIVPAADARGKAVETQPAR
jgi:hypothetical protein